MFCTSDCTCSLCRELRGRNPSKQDFQRLNSKLSESNYNIKSVEKSSMSKSISCNDLSVPDLSGNRNMQKNHKVVIFFGDSIQNKNKSYSQEVLNIANPNVRNVNPLASQLCNEIKEAHQPQVKVDKCSLKDPRNEKFVRNLTESITTTDVMNQLKIVLNAKCGKMDNKSSNETKISNKNVNSDCNSRPPPPPRRNSSLTRQCDDKKRVDLPSYVESVVNGVINIKIEGNYKNATNLIDLIKSDKIKSISSSHNDDFTDWSFVQKWRNEPTSNVRGDLQPIKSSINCMPENINRTQLAMSPLCETKPSFGRIQVPATTVPAQRMQREIASKPQTDHHKESNQQAQRVVIKSPTNLSRIKPQNSHTPEHNLSTSMVVAERDSDMTGNISVKSSAHRSVIAPTRLTVISSPIASQPPMHSIDLKSLNKQNGMIKDSLTTVPNTPVNKTNVNITPVKPMPLNSIESNRVPNGHSNGNRSHQHPASNDYRHLQRVPECVSSSDENRSSGHASMSDTGHGSSSPGGHNVIISVPDDRFGVALLNRSGRSRASTNRIRHRATPAKGPWSGSGLEDIKSAMQQLTMRSQASTSTYSSISAGSESSEPTRRIVRHSSLETVNTNVTCADEFIWINSNNRLVELQYPPWSPECISKVIKIGRCRDNADRISSDTIPRLGYLLQRALVRVAREIQRLSSILGYCAKHEVACAFKIILCPDLADSCIKACLRAAAMFAVPGDGALRQSKSSRAGLQLSVGRFYRWMIDARLGKFIHEYAAIYLCAGIENLLEEIIIQCLPHDCNLSLTANGLENAIALSGDFWGLLQPFVHLNAGRIASGDLTMPRWTSQSSIGSGSGNSPPNNQLEPCLLTTCVGSVSELKELVFRAQHKLNHIPFSLPAYNTLFYFMRCSQLEHTENGGSSKTNSSCSQELCYERAYVVLPPLIEWLRVASAHAEYRHATLIGRDDVMQAARLLLPGVDYPPSNFITIDEELPARSTFPPVHYSSLSVNSNNSNGPNVESIGEHGIRATTVLAFKLMLTGRAELLVQATTLLPHSTRYDTLNYQGLTALMIASIQNDEPVIQALLDAGANSNIEVPLLGYPGCPAIHPGTQNWTALTFAAVHNNYQAARLLLERGANVEGGARLSEDKYTLSPLQVASGVGNAELVSLLLAYGANAFLSTQRKDCLCYSGSAQHGCYSAISVAASHGQRSVLRKLLTHPMAPTNREVLSLEEMLAEGDQMRSKSERTFDSASLKLNKSQVKALQEAMYHSAENNHLDITIELRALGIPWNLHCWMLALAAANELSLDGVIDQLLQDFLQVCPEDYSSQFVTDCLPLLFTIFRYNKKEGTTLLLADIFATCFGWEPIKSIQPPVLTPSNGTRIDPKFVNNPELSDVTFKVEGKVFYGHKIVLVTASPRFQSMLSSKLTDGNSPTVQINDIRYEIFQLVMKFLYSGGCQMLDVAASDILELMAAASFFQLETLLRYTESRCSQIIDTDNVVAMYIHAKVYSAFKLMEYCQGFLLQNMVALLTYDDSVKRLLFAKKIPNHDVLNGLLHTLQSRIKQRSTGPMLTRSSLGNIPISSKTNGINGTPNNHKIK